MHDFTTVTELPGSLLNEQQLARIEQRYALAAQMALGKVVLEVGCGAGAGLSRVARRAAYLVACDVTAKVLALAQEQSGHEQLLVNADGQQLPFPTGHFELLFSFEAIYYLPDPGQFLRESRRVLKPGGQLLLGTSNPDWPHFAPGQLSVAYLNSAQLAAQLNDAGFAVDGLWGSFPTPATPTRRERAVAFLRQRLHNLSWLAADSLLTRRLKRLAYGRLHPLPAALAPIATVDLVRELTLIPTGQRDSRHRVLYALARCDCWLAICRALWPALASVAAVA